MTDTPIADVDDARRAVTDGVPVAEAAAAVVAAMTPEERLWCLDGDLPAVTGMTFLTVEDGYHRLPFVAARVDRLGFPGIAFSDGPRGAVIGNGTSFPVSMARGATWDPDLEERVGDVVGRELRATGADFTGAVCVNVLRHPAWGRAQETYGEDPHHVGEMGAAFTRGLQRHVMACAKHFACNSMENARFVVDVEVDEVALHEVYLPHFRRIVEEGVASLMTAYNAVNGSWCSASTELLADVLRGEWGFEGFTISDFVFGVHDAAASLRAGLDIEMPARQQRYLHLAEALERGEVTWDDVDAAATRVVATVLRFDEVLSTPPPSWDVLGAPDHRALAREVAGRSVVLLRNDPVDGTPVLPLGPNSSVAVVGRHADTVNTGDAGSSDVWDLDCRTVADGLRAAFAEVTVEDDGDPQRAAGVAAGADVAVVVVGYTKDDEGEFLGDLSTLPLHLVPPTEEPEAVAAFEARRAAAPDVPRPERHQAAHASFGAGGDRASLRLPPEDVDLLRAVAAANPRTVVAIQAGSAVVVSEWVDAVPAVVQAWYAGAEAGPGLADVLTGAVDPSGRLPFSVPIDEADLPLFDRDATAFRYDRWHGWWHLARNGTTPAFPFGFGLSYTEFGLADVEARVDGDDVVVTGSVRNLGDRDGADVVQVYADLGEPDAPARLVGFARVEVPAGDATGFEVVVPRRRFELRDPVQHAWRPPDGPVRLRIGRHAVDPDATVVDLGALT